MVLEQSSRWMTTREVAEKLRVDPGRVCDWINQGELTAVNVVQRISFRPRWRISPEALESFLLRRQSPGPSIYLVRRSSSGPRRSSGPTSESDGRLAKNIPHVTRVKRLASIIASRRGGWGSDWKPLLEEAIERYATKHGVRITAEAVMEQHGDEQ